MAIITSITYNGFSETYWRIIDKQENYIDASIILLMGGYADKATRELPGSAPTVIIPSVISGVSYVADMSRALLYPALKSLPQYTGATDDI